MGYLAYLISLLATVVKSTKGLSFIAGLDLFLDTAVRVNKIFFFIILVLWILAVVVISILLSEGNKLSVKTKAGCGGCLLIAIALLPLWHFFLWKMAVGLASAVEPTGIVDVTRFWVLVALSFLLGVL